MKYGNRFVSSKSENVGVVMKGDEKLLKVGKEWRRRGG